MNSYCDIIKQLRGILPDRIMYFHGYTLKDKPEYSIRVSPPCKFDSYVDVIAEVDLCYNKVPFYSCLITINTDLESFKQKISKKLQTHMRTKGKES